MAIVRIRTHLVYLVARLHVVHCWRMLCLWSTQAGVAAWAATRRAVMLVAFTHGVWNGFCRELCCLAPVLPVVRNGGIFIVFPLTPALSPGGGEGDSCLVYFWLAVGDS